MNCSIKCGITDSGVGCVMYELWGNVWDIGSRMYVGC